MTSLNVSVEAALIYDGLKPHELYDGSPAAAGGRLRGRQDQEQKDLLSQNHFVHGSECWEEDAPSADGGRWRPAPYCQDSSTPPLVWDEGGRKPRPTMAAAWRSGSAWGGGPSCCLRVTCGSALSRIHGNQKCTSLLHFTFSEVQRAVFQRKLHLWTPIITHYIIRRINKMEFGRHLLSNIIINTCIKNSIDFHKNSLCVHSSAQINNI